MKNSRHYLLVARSYLDSMDPVLLSFLVLFLNVKIFIKLLALVMIYIIRPHFSFGFRLRRSRLPLFYIAVLLIGLLNYFLYAGFTSLNYSFVFATGAGFWLCCILAANQVKLAVERVPTKVIYQTIFVFLMINVIASGINLASIMVETGEWNPYTYQGLYQKYFIGTGDYIKGITFDTSTTNALINAFGIFFCLSQKRFVAVLVCMAALLLTCSNFVNIITVIGLLFCFFCQRGRDQKSMIVVCVMMLVVFMAKVSPQNNDYVQRTIEKTVKGSVTKANTSIPVPVELRPDSILSPDEKKYKFAKLFLANRAALEKKPVIDDRNKRPTLPVANIHSAPYQHKQDSSAARLQVIDYALHLGRDTSAKKINEQKMPGKLAAIRQTAGYLATHPAKIPFGAGMGNFSSKLAFRATGLQVAGGYPARLVYVSKDFANNQLAIFLDYFGKDSGYRSITNTPNNVYVQLLSEYGIIGLTALFAFYLWFFARSAVITGYTFPILWIVAAALLADYWFEQLSILVLFELLLYVHQKENGLQHGH